MTDDDKEECDSNHNEDNEDIVNDEDCDKNPMNDIHFDTDVRSQILLGISIEIGQVTNSSKRLVERRLKNKTLSVYAMTYCTAMCYLARLQHDHRVSKGIGVKQAISARDEAMSRLDIRAFLFDKSPHTLVGNEKCFRHLLAKLKWEVGLDKKLQIIRYSEDFLIAKEKVTSKYLD